MIVVPVDEDVAFAAAAVEELLLVVDDRVAGAGDGAKVAAAIAEAAEPGRLAGYQPLLAGVEQTPLHCLAGLASDSLVSSASAAIASDAPFEVLEAVEEVGDRLIPGPGPGDGGRSLRRQAGRLLLVAGIDHGPDAAVVADLAHRGGRVHLIGEAAAAFARARDRIIAAWAPGDALTRFAWAGLSPGTGRSRPAPP